MANPLADRVRVVIEQVANSHTAFGSMVGISKDKLSKSLTGSRRFTSLELALIAEAGGVTVDWLLSGIAPAGPSIAARTAEGVALDVSPVTEAANRYMAAFDVLDLIGEHSRAPELPLISDELTLRDQGEALAAYASEVMIQAGYVVNELDMADLASSVERLFGVDVAIGVLPVGLDGLAWQKDGRRLIFLAPTKQWTRQRFTFVHELGHILAGDAQQILVDQNLSPGLDRHPSEVRANSFAAAFLMPANEFRSLADNHPDRRSFARLVVTYKVSPSAMAVRLRSLSRLSGTAFDQLKTMTLLESHELAGDLERYVKQVNGAIAERVPSQLVQALFRAYWDGHITLRPLANLLAVDVDDLHDVLSGTPQYSATNSESVYSL